jgi:Protein of unknown function (DUF3800)
MKFCYVDESGTGNESIIVMVGVIVDAQRMHKTKDAWDDLLRRLSGRLKRSVVEFHTREFYSGNGPWRDIPGDERSAIIDEIIDWVNERKHKIMCAAIDKAKYDEAQKTSPELANLKTPWLAAAMSLVTKVQREHQKEPKNKGHTAFIFDRRRQEEDRLSDMLYNPPEWTGTLYERKKRAVPFDQIIDVPYFADSRPVLLIQVADLFSYLIRRKIEVARGLTAPRYADEADKLRAWCDRLDALCVCGWYPGSKKFKAKGTVFLGLLP